MGASGASALYYRDAIMCINSWQNWLVVSFLAHALVVRWSPLAVLAFADAARVVRRGVSSGTSAAHDASSLSWLPAVGIAIARLAITQAFSSDT